MTGDRVVAVAAATSSVAAGLYGWTGAPPLLSAAVAAAVLAVLRASHPHGAGRGGA